MRENEKKGLYFQGEFITDSYSDAIKAVFELNEIPKRFGINSDHEATGYSVVDGNGVQHIYDLSPNMFYSALSDLE